jgi:hypothetical protein
MNSTDYKAFWVILGLVLFTSLGLGFWGAIIRLIWKAVHHAR